MKQIKTIIYFEWLNFRAERGLLIFSVLMLLAGFYGIFAGSSAITRQKHQIEGLTGLYAKHVKELKQQFPGESDAGDIGYYHTSFAKHMPDSWAALAIGQRDVNPAYLKIRLLALQGQLYNTENTNPNQLAAGSFDLAFVFVFLLPLFIIAISFNLRSAEKENGTLTMLLSQPLSLLRLCLGKLIFRFLLILILILVLLFSGVIWSGAAPDGRIFLWLAALIAYSLFWFGIAFMIIALNKSSAFNAVTLLGIWLLLAVIFPVMIDQLAGLQKPVPDGLEITMKQREEVHGGWDKPREETMANFFVHYPQYSKTTPVAGRFGWKWYFAFQEMGDRSVARQAARYSAKLADRQDYIAALSVVSPPALLQGLLNTSAATDLPRHLLFLKSVKGYHDRLKRFYYPFLFEDKPFTHADLEQEPQHTFQAAADLHTVQTALLKLMLAAILVFAVSVFIFRFHQQSLR